jgi:tetratricopeptide (TPR) repeat protein
MSYVDIGRQARQVTDLLQLVAQADQHLRGPDQLRWATVLRQERDALDDAIDWATEHDQRLALELVAGLSTYWWMHGLRDEAAQAAGGLLDALGAEVPDGLHEEYVLAVLHAVGVARAEQVERAQAIVLETSGPFRHPVTVLLWSVVLGPFTSPELVTEVLARNERSTDPWTLAALQICNAYPGLTGSSEASLESAYAGFQLVGDRWGSSLALNALAEQAAWATQYERSADLIGEALVIAGELGNEAEAASLLCRRADLRLRLRDLRTASDDYRQALVRANRAGVLDTSAAARLGLAKAARYGGDLAKAQELALVALSRCPEDWDDADLAMTEALGELAAIAAAAGRPDEAHSWRLKAGLVSEQYRPAGL